MARLLITVVWVNKSGVPNNLTDVQRINIRRGSDIKHNTCDITLANNMYTARPYVDSASSEIQFEPEQAVEVYAKYDEEGTDIDTSSTDNLVFSGRVVEYDAEYDADKTSIKLKCSDSSYIALNKLFVGDETDTPPNLIMHVISYVNDTIDEPEKQISAALVSNGGFIADEKTNANGDGSFTFNSKQISKVFKPAYEVLQELSQTGYTEDGEIPYRFHIDKQNRFHWFYPSDSAAHVLNVGSTTAQSATYTHPVTEEEEFVDDSNIHHITQVKLKKAVYEVTNFIIYKAGEDLNNVQILHFKYDDSTGAPVVKDSFRNWENIARELKVAEENIGNLALDNGDIYTIVDTNSVTSWGVAYTDADEYNDAFIVEARRKASAQASAEFKKTGSPRWKGSIELKGSDLFDANDGIIFTSNVHGIQRVFLRVTDVQHTIDKGGWFTTIQVEEELTKKTTS
jgi:hypothetical protein